MIMMMVVVMMILIIMIIMMAVKIVTTLLQTIQALQANSLTKAKGRWGLIGLTVLSVGESQ